MDTEIVKIVQKDFLGKGGTKMVYRHPENPDLCIKFPKERRRALHGLLREIKYLKRHQDALPFLAPYLGEIQCDMGTGYLYEVVKNEDGSPSTGIGEHLHRLDKDVLGEKIKIIYQQLVAEHAVVNDLQFNNIFVKEKKSGDYDLCLVDGFGNTDYIKICDYSKFFLLKKLHRKFKKLCRKLEIPHDFLYE